MPKHLTCSNGGLFELRQGTKLLKREQGTGKHCWSITYDMNALET